MKREEFRVVKQRLEADPRQKIQYAEFLNLCTEVGLSNEDAKRLSSSLTDCGIIFHLPSSKDPIVASTILLKPQNFSDILRSMFSEKVLFSGAQSLDEYHALEAEYIALSKQKEVLDARAHSYANKWVFGCGLYMIAQAGVLARLTWWEFSWDIMEPVTYFITFSTGIVGWMYFAMTKSEYTYENLRDNLAHQRRATLYARNNFDLKRYEHLHKIFANEANVLRSHHIDPIPKIKKRIE